MKIEWDKHGERFALGAALLWVGAIAAIILWSLTLCWQLTLSLFVVAFVIYGIGYLGAKWAS